MKVRSWKINEEYKNIRQKLFVFGYYYDMVFVSNDNGFRFLLLDVEKDDLNAKTNWGLITCENGNFEFDKSYHTIKYKKERIREFIRKAGIIVNGIALDHLMNLKNANLIK